MDVTFNSEDTILAFDSGIREIRDKTSYRIHKRGERCPIYGLEDTLSIGKWTQQEFGGPAISDTGIITAANWTCHQN